MSRSSKELPRDGLGASGIPVGGCGPGTADLGIDGGTAGGVANGAPPGLRPGAVTDGIFPEISASKMPAVGTGFGEIGAAGIGGVEETGGIGGPADGGLAPTVNPAIGGKGGRVEPAGSESPEGGLVPVNPVIGGSGSPVEDPAGGLAPTVRPGIGGSGTPVKDPAGGLAPTVKPGIGGSGAAVVPKGDETPKDAGLTAGEAGTTGLMGKSVVLTSGIAAGAETPVDFFVAKVKISFVPTSAFSATAVPP